MSRLLWTLQSLLALFFLFSASFKLLAPIDTIQQQLPSSLSAASARSSCWVPSASSFPRSCASSRISRRWPPPAWFCS